MIAYLNTPQTMTRWELMLVSMIAYALTRGILWTIRRVYDWWLNHG